MNFSTWTDQLVELIASPMPALRVREAWKTAANRVCLPLGVFLILYSAYLMTNLFRPAGVKITPVNSVGNIDY